MGNQSNGEITFATKLKTTLTEKKFPPKVSSIVAEPILHGLCSDYKKKKFSETCGVTSIETTLNLTSLK